MIDRLQGFFGFTRTPFGRDLAPGMLHRHATLVPQTAEALATEQAERGRTPVLVIDEAHLLDHPQLELIRMLTNHDIDSTGPFACLLVGQPTLRRRMKLGVLAALGQRIGLRYAMGPMTGEETGSYLRHHADPPDQPRLPASGQQPRRPSTYRRLRRQQEHRRRIRRPRRSRRGHRRMIKTPP